jgi:hypothetical protein
VPPPPIRLTSSEWDALPRNARRVEAGVRYVAMWGAEGEATGFRWTRVELVPDGTADADDARR